MIAFIKSEISPTHCVLVSKPEDCVVQSMPDVSPTKWHLAHTTWFFETFILKKFVPGYRAEIPQYAYLFNSYYNAAGDMHRRDLRGIDLAPNGEPGKPLSRIDRFAHRRSTLQVRTKSCSMKSNRFSSSASITNSNIRNCSSQTSSTCSRKIRSILFFVEARTPSAPKLAKTAHDRPYQFIDFDETMAAIGHDGDGFAYDNEGPRHRALVPAFSLATRPVTNGEYHRIHRGQWI